MGGKLDIRWTGPYEVCEDAGKMRYKLKCKKTGRALKQLVHCSRLKPYIHPTDAEEEWDATDSSTVQQKEDDRVSNRFS